MHDGTETTPDELRARIDAKIRQPILWGLEDPCGTERATAWADYILAWVMEVVGPELKRLTLSRNAANAMAGVGKRRAERLRTELEHAKAALAGDSEGIRLWMLDCAAATERWRQHAKRAERAAEEAELELEQLAKQAEDIAGHAWVVPRIVHDQGAIVGPRILANGRIACTAGESDPWHARQYAAQLLAAADEVDPTHQTAPEGDALKAAVERAERAEAAIERVRALVTPSPGADPWYVSAPAVLAALDHPTGETR